MLVGSLTKEKRGPTPIVTDIITPIFNARRSCPSVVGSLINSLLEGKTKRNHT